jgi:hypothetical protein
MACNAQSPLEEMLQRQANIKEEEWKIISK